MATGIEIAGLALAVFPLVIGGIQFYADKVQTINEMRHYAVVLRALGRELGMEQCKLKNTCMLLLQGLVSDSDVTELINLPGGPLWGDKDLQMKLESRLLLPDTVTHYMKAMEELWSEVVKLQNQFEPSPEEVELADKRAIKKKLKGITVVLKKTGHKETLASIAKINFDLATLTEQGKSISPPAQVTAPAKHYNRIRTQAINLYEVLKEKFQAAPACKCAVPHNANLRLEVRSAAAAQNACGLEKGLRFHVVLSFQGSPDTEPLPRDWREMGLEPLDSEKGSWDSEQDSRGWKPEPWESKRHSLGNDQANSSVLGDNSCHTDTVPDLTLTADNTDSNVGGGPVGFRDSLRTFSHSVLDIVRPKSPYKPATPPVKAPALKRPQSEGQPTKSTRVAFTQHASYLGTKAPEFPSRSAAEPIENLCLVIQEGVNEPSCLGVLTDGKNRRYLVWPPVTPLFVPEPKKTLSLEDLLASPKPFKKKDRLILGVQLASTVMQLHTTKWLSENWGKKDILFCQEDTPMESEGDTDTGSVIWKPLVRQTFVPGLSQPPSESLHKPTKSKLVRHDQTLFSLGVILVELWFGKTLESLWTEADGNRIGGVTDMTDYETATRLTNEIYDEAGEKYGDAVRRCIGGLDHRYSSLKKDDFKNEVHIKVVCPLVENLEAFCNAKLEELF